MLQYIGVKLTILLCGPVHWSALKCSSLYCGAVQCSTVKYGAVPCLQSLQTQSPPVFWRACCRLCTLEGVCRFLRKHRGGGHTSQAGRKLEIGTNCTHYTLHNTTQSIHYTLKSVVIYIHYIVSNITLNLQLLWWHYSVSQNIFPVYLSLLCGSIVSPKAFFF